ncbi:uncharacterized protein LOC114263750 [Camellia sinensis]|uniref:uncharacterized protein LOC114263750 n=1 Tax=Camellia sinensis TaxID=4442 RepID=UPI0010368F83|nr:uncharacterized protein LOC114263750 [Camellia sinensis]
MLDKDLNDDDFLWVSGNFEDYEAQIPGYNINWNKGSPDYAYTNQAALRAALQYHHHDWTELLGVVLMYRYSGKRKNKEWYEALDQHFNWLLQYKISPYFCRWGDSMRVHYAGPSDAPLASNNFEAFLKVPEFLRPHTQIYCTSEWVLGNREDLAKDIIAELQPENCEEWWTYVCMGPSDPHPNWHLGMRGTQHRAVMWRVWKEGGTGFLYWGANCYEKATVGSAEIRFRRGLPPGDGVLFYPGEVFSSSHNPVASLRLERLLSGLQDIEYLKLYASKFGRGESVSLLEKTGMYLGPERYTHEHMPIDVMRSEIFRTCRS